MKVILFGATGMIGQGVLRECLLDPGVERVLAVGRSPLRRTDPKLAQIVRADLSDFSAVEAELTGYDACFFCLGVSSSGMTEEQYTRITFEYTLAAARVLAETNPGMTFTYVSGSGTREDEKGSMWARVKGKTENALLALPLKAVMFRPGLIKPMHGIKSKTRFYRVFYTAATPLLPVIGLVAKNAITTTENMGKAMLEVARHGAPAPRLGMREINELAARA